MELTSHQQLIKEAAEADLIQFIRLIAPHRVLGAIHEEWLRWSTREGASDHQLTLLPRDHQKSVLTAYRVCWWITKHPDTSILYNCSESPLAELQLQFIKNVLTSPVYRKFWPEMVNEDRGKRAKWTADQIVIDHPLRKAEGVRDPTVMAAGLGTGTTGFHFRVAVMDDIVTYKNAYTSEGRSKVEALYSLLSSVETIGTDESGSQMEWVVGTRYDARDIYGKMLEMEMDVWDDEGNVIAKDPVFEVFQKQVENIGDGTGEFLWPRQQRNDGAWFGFNQELLSKKKAKYLDTAQFYAQYYNNPNDPTNLAIDSSKFQWYEKKHINSSDLGRWYFKEHPLNVYAAIDLAFSLKEKADHTALVVIGIDPRGNIYVLDIDRFKTDRTSVYWDHIKAKHAKWGFRKIRAETNAGQKVILNSLKDYIKAEGQLLSFDEVHRSRHMGMKAERTDAILEPKYANMAIWHYKGGNCQTLEEEVSMKRPAHDDIKDALADAVSIAIPPRNVVLLQPQNTQSFNKRYGGWNYNTSQARH